MTFIKRDVFLIGLEFTQRKEEMVGSDHRLRKRGRATTEGTG
jgi:hypothetical protein